MFGLRSTQIRRVTVLFVLANLMSLTALAPTRVTLAWNPSDGVLIAGYRLYAGLAPGVYSTMMDVGNATTATVAPLASGVTYFFAVTAYDIAGLESAFSDPVSFTAPVTGSDRATLSLSFAPGRDATLTGTAPVGFTYDVLTSTDLSHWTTLASTLTDPTGSFQLTAPISAGEATRYYRLRQTFP